MKADIGRQRVATRSDGADRRGRAPKWGITSRPKRVSQSWRM
jgi:hypothetical protein